MSFGRGGGTHNLKRSSRPFAFSRAISTSFLPTSCSNCRIRRSTSYTVPSSENNYAPRSRNSFVQSPTELGWMPYCLAICPGVFSPASASTSSRCPYGSTIWNFTFGEYLFLAMASASLRHSPGRSPPHFPTRSTPHYSRVQLKGVITANRRTTLMVAAGMARAYTTHPILMAASNLHFLRAK